GQAQRPLPLYCLRSTTRPCPRGGAACPAWLLQISPYLLVTGADAGHSALMQREPAQALRAEALGLCHPIQLDQLIHVAVAAEQRRISRGRRGIGSNVTFREQSRREAGRVG